MVNGRVSVQGALPFKKTLTSNIILLETLTDVQNAYRDSGEKQRFIKNIPIILCASLLILNA